MFGDTVAGGCLVRCAPPSRCRLTAHPPARPCGTSADLSEDHSCLLFTFVWGPFDSPPPPGAPSDLRPQTSSRDTRQDRQLTAAQIPKLGRGPCTSGPKRRARRCPVPAVLVVHTLCYILPRPNGEVATERRRLGTTI